MAAATATIAQQQQKQDPGAAADHGRSIPAHVVPVPNTVSSEMQAWIAHPVPPLTTVPPKTPDEWRDLVKRQVEARMPFYHELRQLFPCKVEPTTVAGVKCFLVTPDNADPKNADDLVLHLHGGAYVFSPGEIGAGEAAVLAHYSKMQVLSVDYRMPPDHPYPAAVDDAVAVYQELLKKHAAKKLVVFGTSAGGGLAAAMLQKLLSLKAPMPAALGLGTPWADISKTGDTIYALADLDQVLIHYDGVLGAAAKLYANGRDLSDPGLSPVNGEFKGFPPTILIAGTRDMLLSATVRVHRKLRAAGIEADLHVFEAASHGFYVSVPKSPESRETFSEVAQFFATHLGH